MLLIFLIFLTAAAGCPYTPHQCTCSQDQEIVYSCDIDGVKFELRAATNDHAHITCQEGTLTCDNMPSIPISHNDTLTSLKLSSCKLPSALACLLGRVGARDVLRVTLDDLRDELGEEHLRGLNKLKSLILSNAALQTSVPFGALAGLPHLRDVIIHKAKIQLQNHIRTVSNNVLNLDLGSNQIREIPDGAFSSLANLTELFLWRNQLTRLEKGAFRGLNHLKFLDLSYNPLRELPAVFHSALILEVLVLMETDLELVRKAALSGHPKLVQVTIENGNSLLTFENGSFSNLSSLQVVVISSTPLTPIPSDLFENSTSLTNLNITSCDLKELPRLLFEDQENLKLLNICNNHIKKLDKDLFLKLRNLELLDLSRNELQELPEQIFDGLTNLVEVKLDYNQLVTIHQHTFSGPRILQTLTLSHNHLTLLKDNKVEKTNKSPFSNLSKLELLDLSHNQLSVIFDDWRLSLIHRIRRIDLSSNQFTRLRKQDIEFTAINLTIDLQNNSISTIEVGPRLHNYAASNHRQVFFLLKNNPFICNCDIYPFLKFARKNTLPSFEISTLQCVSPSETKDKTLETIPLEDLTCDLPKCPNNCTCTMRPADSMIELDCLETPDLYEFPDPNVYNMATSELKIRHFTHSILPKHVILLNLSDCNLFEVPILPSHLHVVDLSLNNLAYIPDRILNQNFTLFLRGNQLQCSCATQNKIKALLHSKDSIVDYGEVICDNGSYLDKIDIGHICDVWLATVIGSILAALGLIAAAVAALVYHYSKEIKIYIYGKGWNLFIHEYEVDGKSYDVLVSYADSCEKLAVQKLVPILEDEGYRVCVRYRDWDVGDWIPGKVADLVDKSRRTIVLISKDYLESVSALELHAALMSEKRDKRRRVLVVATKDLVPDPELQELLIWKKCMDFEDSAFWSNLKRKLPRHPEKVHDKSKWTSRALNGLITSDGKVVFHFDKSSNNIPDTV